MADQRLRQRRHIRKIRRPLGDAIGAGDLHIYTAGFHQVEQCDEIRLARTLSRIAAAEMVDHHRERHLSEVILQPRDDGRASVDLHMPAQPADLLDGRVENGFGIGRIEPSRRVGFEIKPHAANARGCHLLQRLARCGPVDDRNAARARPHAAHGVKRAGVVGAVDARLHHHDAIEVKVALELEQLLDGSLRRRVDALFCKWKLRRVAKHVDVAIAGAARHIEIDCGAAGSAYGDPCPHHPSPRSRRHSPGPALRVVSAWRRPPIFFSHTIRRRASAGKGTDRLSLLLRPRCDRPFPLAIE